MRILSIIQPSEMGPDFRFEDDVWKVNFPAGSGGGGGVPLSTDANNAIGLGTDQGAFISTDLLGAYALTQDNGSKKINLYRFPVGAEFNPETATLISSVNLIELTGVFDDVAIDGALITFTDADTGLTLTIDTANLQKVSDLVGSDSVAVNLEGSLTTLSVKISPHPDNLIQVTEDGLLVIGNEAGGTDVDLHQTLAPVENGLCHAIGSSHLVVPQIELTDVAGRPIGYINNLIGLPAFSTTEGFDHCPKWEAPTAGNCRIGKIAVSLVEDLLYEIVEEGQEVGTSIKWRIFINGVDTKYNASSGRGIGGPIAISPESGEIGPPMAMPISKDGYPEDDVMGSGYLEEIISQASNGVVNGDNNDGLILWNNTNSQVIITLVPSMPITVNDINNAFGGDGIKIYGMNEEQLSIIKDKLPASEASEPPTVENLEDYFSDVDGGALTICLAPNPNGNGGTTGPQISCANATDRFATSGSWGKYTLKINGAAVATNANFDLILDILRDRGVRTEYNGGMETNFRNTTDQNIRIEIEVISEQSWNQQGLTLDLTTNPTLMGHDPIEETIAAFGFNSELVDDRPKLYRRLTVCLAPADTRMNWKYKELSTSTALVTLSNSVNLRNVDQDFSFEGEPAINVTTKADKWGDLTWTIHASEPLRHDVTLSITAENYEDEHTVDFLARRPMVVTLANTHEYSRLVEVHSPFEDVVSTITSIEVVGKNGSTVIRDPEDGLVIDAAIGSIRVEDIENAKFSYMVQGRFLDGESADTMMVKFVTEADLEEIVIVDLATTKALGFQSISTNPISKVVIGLVDNNNYIDVNALPAIQVMSPEWKHAILRRVNGVGGEVEMEFNFTTVSTYQIHIQAYLNGANLAVLGDCVIGVDEWGELEAGGYTFNRETYEGRFEADRIDFTDINKNNLAYVPVEGPSNLQNMTGMFAGTDLTDPSVDLSAYNVSSVYMMAGVFANSNFNRGISRWDMRYVHSLDYAFYASKFRQDLSLWCVPNIQQEPELFSHRSTLLAAQKPVWGTCPLNGTNTTSEWGEFSLRNGIESNGFRSYGLEDDFISKIRPQFTSAGKIKEAISYSPMRYLGKRSLKDQEINKLTLLDGMLLIDDQALMNNQLTTVTFPSTVKTIGVEAFAENPLTTVTVLANTPPSLGLNALPETVTDIITFDEIMPAYAKHKDWKVHAGKFKPISQVVGVVYESMSGKKGFLPGSVITDSALENSQALILSINDGVTTLENDALFGTYANALKIPNSLTTVVGAALNVSAQILEFEEGRENTAFMNDSLLSADMIIIPSTMTELTSWVTMGVPRVIVSKAVVPPTLGLWNEYVWNANNTEFRTSLGTWYSYSGTGCEELYVPAESVEAYRADPHWSKYTSNILPLQDLNYGNVKKIKMTTSGAQYQISGTTDLASVGKEVTVRYFESIYNKGTGTNVPTNIITYNTTVKADGTFTITIPARDNLANHYVDAAIGAGNRPMTSSRA